MALDPRRLDEALREAARHLPEDIGVLGEDLRRNLRALLEGVIERMDLAPREELDVQRAVLERSREQLERLERRVAELEARLGESGRAPPPGGG